MKLYFLGSLIPYFIYIFIKSKHSLLMLQQNFYNENNRYLKWILNNKNKAFLGWDLLFIILSLLPFSMENFNVYIRMLIFLLFSLLLILIYRDKEKEAKVKLATTKRIKRLYVSFFLVYALIIFIFYINFNSRFIWIYYGVLALLAYLEYYYVYIINIVNKPVERSIYYHYKRQALAKLKEMDYMQVIGVTGSYGKTTTKNVIATILGIKYNAFASPKNYNTDYGLINTINNYLDKYVDYFVAEMGATARYDIKKCCDIVKPKIGVLTRLGEAHLESFGSLANIDRTKFELIESLPKDGFGVLNLDDERQRNYQVKNSCPLYWIGINNNKADLNATNIKMTDSGMTFEVTFKDIKKKVSFKTSLLGQYNIYNLLAGLLIGYNLGLSMEELQIGVAKITPVEHRLELKTIEDIHFIDDAYNSNPMGSKMALEVLSLMNGEKIIVTPGMVELGPDQAKLNYQFGEQMATTCDRIILVGSKQTKPIYEALMAKKYDEKKLYVIEDVKEAFTLVKEFKTKKTKYVLLENDLPDIFI